MTAAPAKPAVWPVIHLKDVARAVRNAETAAACGCAGVFVISMDHCDDRVDPAAEEIRDRCPQLAVGVNYLTETADRALRRSLARGHHATWADYSGIRSDRTEAMAHRCQSIMKDAPGHLFFAGVAFKYLEEDPDPARAAAIALGLGFVPTTTGIATGAAPEIDKLEKIRVVIGRDAPLALASGVSPDNIGLLGPHLSHVLVATGVSRTFHDFDPDKLARLMANLPERRR